MYICGNINGKNMNNTQIEPQNIISIKIANYDTYVKNVERAYEKNLEHCPCCGKAIPNPKFFVNSIYGGSFYPANDKNQYNDAWVMGVGSECRKKFPEGYIFTN